MRNGTMALGLALLVFTGCSGEDIDFDTSIPDATELGTEELKGSFNYLFEARVPNAAPIAAHFEAMDASAASGIVVLEQGAGDVPRLAAWHASGARRSGTITVLDQDLITVVARVTFTDAHVISLDLHPGGIDELRLQATQLHPND
jgi:hypothetical protein